MNSVFKILETHCRYAQTACRWTQHPGVRLSQVRSWSFEADGGFGEGVWTNEGDRWIIKTNAILPDGKKLTATNIVTRNGPDAVTWQSKDRTLDGKALPDYGGGFHAGYVSGPYGTAYAAGVYRRPIW
jgi:hypothetical protein